MEDHATHQLDTLIELGDEQGVVQLLESCSGTEIARAIFRLPREKKGQLLEMLRPAEAAGVVERLADVQAAQIVEHLEPEAAAAIVHELPSNEQADLVGDLSPLQATAILDRLEPAEAGQVQRLAGYPDDVAGGLMITEVLVCPENWTVARLREDFRQHAERYRDFPIQYAFVVSPENRLTGVLPMRELVLADENRTIGSLMIPNPVSVGEWASLERLHELFDEHQYLAVPVVDEGGALLGLVTRAAMEEAAGQRLESDYLKTQGILQEELRSLPTLARSRRRLAWLSINIVLNLLAASIIALYQETLAQVIALAVFLPIISDMSGCSGNQAIAVSMRELSLGLAKPGDVLRVWLQEVVVGLLIGISLGLLIAVVAILWQGNLYLGLVVGIALSLNTLISVSLGGTLPLIIKGLGMDPALASGPVLTTVTDMCGFFLVLSIASAMLPLLTGQANLLVG